MSSHDPHDVLDHRTLMFSIGDLVDPKRTSSAEFESVLDQP